MSDPYQIRDHVPDFDAWVDAWRTRSLQARNRLAGRTGVPFGPSPTDRLDLFFPSGGAEPRPVHIFIHGGYWRAFSKDDFSYIADAVTAAGAIAAIIDYALMPGARMRQLIEQVRGACDWVGVHAGEFGGDPERISISGHSAGAHLAAMACLPGATSCRIRSALLVSGLYELAPLAASFIQAEIQLTTDEIDSFSPLRCPGNPAVGYALWSAPARPSPFISKRAITSAISSARRAPPR